MNVINPLSVSVSEADPKGHRRYNFCEQKKKKQQKKKTNEVIIIRSKDLLLLP